MQCAIPIILYKIFVFIFGILLFRMESEWGKHAQINHSKPEQLGVGKLNLHMGTRGTEASKQVCPTMTTGGAITSGQAYMVAPLAPFYKLN